MRWKARTKDGDELDKGAAPVEPFWGMPSPDSPTDECYGGGGDRSFQFTEGPQQHVTALPNDCQYLSSCSGHFYRTFIKANGHPSLSHPSSYISFRLVVASALQIALCPMNSTKGNLKKRIDGVGDSEPSM